MDGVGQQSAHESHTSPHAVMEKHNSGNYFNVAFVTRMNRNHQFQKSDTQVRQTMPPSPLHRISVSWKFPYEIIYARTFVRGDKGMFLMNANRQICFRKVRNEIRRSCRDSSDR